MNMRRRYTQDSCCHDCPDHKPVTEAEDGSLITCRQGCEKWEKHEMETRQKEAEKNLFFQSIPESRKKEMSIRKNLRNKSRGRT
mgnify:CR=1 FL=1